MRNSSAAFLVASLALLAASLITAATGQEAPGPIRPTVGVVDIGKLFSEYERKDTLEQEINEYREQVKAEVSGVRDELEQLVKSLDDDLKNYKVKKGSPEYDIRLEQIKLAEFKLKQYSERRQGELKDRVEKFTLKILGELEAGTAAYAKRQGIDLVLKVDRSGQLGGGELSKRTKEGFQERVFRAQIQDVFYFGQALDITDGVIRSLNQEKRKKF